jgi:hypothetical protein
MPAYTPDKLDLTIYQNASWTETLRLHVGNADSAVQNLTGYTASFTVKANPGDGTALLTLSSGSGITLGGSAGTIVLSRSLAQVNAFTWTDGEYELTLTDGSGNTSLLLYGSVKVVTF